MAEYRQLKISAEPDVVAAFKMYCEDRGVSMTGELTSYMRTRTGNVRKESAAKFQTRDQRRKATRRIACELSEILAREESYLDAIPENLRGSAACESAQETTYALAEAIESLENSF